MIPNPSMPQSSSGLRCAVNDVVVHPNQGELISCDQAGRIKQWDLSDNICTHELVRYSSVRLLRVADAG